jgi:hypothetical protein
MIVVCPCCQRRYRHDFAGDHAAPMAHCSACDERFPLALPKRTYVLAEGGEAATAPRFPLGADAPGLSGSTSPAAAGDGTVIADDLSVSTPTETVSSIEIELPAAGDLPPADDLSEAAGEIAEVAPEASTDGAAEVRPRASRRGRAILESVVALFPCGIGAAMAYHFAGPYDQDPFTWAALGGAIGLLMGWACLLWITRGD